jgi:benzil reductase ((S)-benzoin forming)
LKQVFITGTSRGLGKALAETFLDKGWMVVGIGRTHTISHAQYVPLVADLSLPGSAEALELPIQHEAQQIALIHNAASLGHIAPMGQNDAESLQKGFQLNLTSVAILTNRFLALTADQQYTRSIVSISSGASKNAYDGWGMYCSSKAGLDALMQVLVQEVKLQNDTRTQVWTIAPGVIDTEMQAQIRTSSHQEFSNVERFIELKNQQQLSSPKAVALKLIDHLFGTIPLENGRYDMREFV